MQKIPAILKLRQSESKAGVEAASIIEIKTIKQNICALLRTKKNQSQLYTHVGDNDICGQDVNINLNTR